MPINFAQNSVAARFRDCNHAIDALDIVKLNGQSLRHDRVHIQVRRCEYLFDSLDRARFALKPRCRKENRLAPADNRVQHFDESLPRGGGEQSPLEPAQAEYFPDEVDDFPNPNIFQNVFRLNGSRNPGEKLVISPSMIGEGPKSPNAIGRRVVVSAGKFASVLLIRTPREPFLVCSNRPSDARDKGVSSFIQWNLSMSLRNRTLARPERHKRLAS